jgi:cyclopropane fatty-acyl-phospholipid synthase-like methyltransferase
VPKAFAPCLVGSTLGLIIACAHAPSEGGHTAHPSHPAHGGMSHQGGMPHSFDNADEWAQHFENPARDAWQKPDEVLAALALAPDAKVADVGSGTGYFAVRLARVVPQGHVYGVDIEPDMARYLGERARREGLSNLTPVLAAPDDARLPEQVDLVLVVDTYHHIGEREAYFRRLLGSLRPRGRVAIIDYRKGQPKGPPEQHRLAPDQVRRELESAGYRFVEEHGFLPNQYFLVFSRAGA